MPDVFTQTQFSLSLINKPGVLAQVAGALADEKVNIKALTLVDSQEHGVLRLVADNAGHAQSVLAKLNLPMTQTDVLCLELPNQPGVLADIAGLLGENHINISYAYCTSGAPGGRTTAIFKVADPKKAQQVLRGSMAKHKEPNVRRPGTRR